MTEKEMYDRINGVSQDTGFSINEKARGLDGTFAALMRKVYVWMTLALVIISGAINRLSLTTATLLFIIYSVLNGAMLSSIFVIYEPMVIAKYSSSQQAPSEPWHSMAIPLSATSVRLGRFCSWL